MSYVNYQDGETALAIRVGGVEIVSSARIADFVSLKVGSTEVISSTRAISNVTTIQTTGYIGIGGSPSNPLTIADNSANAMIYAVQSGAGDLCAFVSGATEHFRIKNSGLIEANAGQIKFPATQNASANANTLDDYEEGTWTPALVPQTSGTVTPSVAAGAYVKIGSLVTVTGIIVVTSVSSPLGTLRLTGLPFTVATGNAYDSAVALRYSNLTSGATTVVTGGITNATAYITLRKFAAGAESALAGDVQAGTFFQWSATYFTA